MTDRELINLAIEAANNAYAPYSRFSVGAALECGDGTVITGCNVECAALGGSICAERNALCAAIGKGYRNFKRIAVYADCQDYCVPCGTCRQLLSEFAPNMEVLCVKSGGRYVSYRLYDLLPASFGPDYLNS
ncbi:MAG: cytidine deaminase [Oscillospiraceae bacterium]|nr:cytidine deaminase [Oscillospiraceae bacterium]